MKLKLIALLALLIIASPLFSQKLVVSKGDIKKYEKAVKLFDDAKLEEADKILSKLTVKYPWQSQIWDMLAKVRYYDYLYAANNKSGKTITVTTNKDGDENDPLAKMLADMLNASIDPSAAKKRLFINTCREATQKAYLASYASVLLRNMLVDEKVDTAVDPAAKEQFNLAEDEFGKGNYNSAIKYYKKALDFDSTYYKAKLYLGDAYYMKKDYAIAVRYFKEAMRVQPNQLEPRKFAVDALYYLGSYEEALSECKDAIIVFPDVVMFDKMEMIADELKMKFDKHWIARGVLPNKIGEKRSGTENKAWKPYVMAHDKIMPVCDERGVITKTTPLTTARYAEVFAWEELLKNSPTTSFTEARKMQNLGYLDCYVFISQFHIDIYDQYIDFAANNRERIIKYFDLLVTK